MPAGAERAAGPASRDEPRRLSPRVRALAVPARPDAAEHARRTFSDRYGTAPGLTLESPGWIFLVHCEGPARVGATATGSVHAVLLGDLFGHGPTDAAAVASAVADRGDAAMTELNGAYGLIVLDRERDRLLLVADRFASRRIYTSRTPDGWFITTDVGDQPTGSFPVDPVAVGWLLGSSYIGAFRSPFEGIRPVERAHVLELGESGATATRYWSHLFALPADDADEGALAGELADRMLEAVRRRVPDGRPAYLSMSGGMDSLAIATVFADQMGRKDLQAVSYAYGEPLPWTDAGVARAVSAQLGIPHRVVQSYGGRFMPFLRRNAEWGEGAALISLIVDAWLELGSELDGAAPVILTGDESWGRRQPPCRDREDIHRLLHLTLPRFSPPAEAELGADLMRTFRDGVRADVDALIDRQPADHPTSAVYEYVVLDQKSCFIMPWRERYQGRFFAVHSPWLDHDVLDFMGSVPFRMRQGKALFDRALADRWPIVARYPRPTEERTRPDYPPLLAAHAPALSRWLASTTSRLDEVVPPAFGTALLREVAEPGWIRGLKRGARRMRRRLGLKDPVAGRAAAHKTLWRYLGLRMALGADWPDD